VLNIEEIQQIIPHRPPFLLVDRIEALEVGKSAIGIKNVTMNEPYFAGHFPDYAVMPGILIVEALAQVGAVAILSKEENKGRLALFAGIDRLRFRDQVRPGDTLRLSVNLIRLRATVGRGEAIATVEGKVVAEGEIMFALQAK